MEEKHLRDLLEKLKNNEIKVTEALEKLKELPFSDLTFAKVDHHRTLRKGFPEVIYCPGKTNQQITKISREILSKSLTLVATRAEIDDFEAISKAAEDAVYHQEAKLVTVDRREFKEKIGMVAVVAGGTSDFPVAEEAALTASMMGANIERIYDVGVAGLHRLLSFTEIIQKATAIVAVAGMEGALPSIIGGMAEGPVIAVPTSIGYGANLGGIAPLLAMLNSCSPGVTVVNIDNGFGAGFTAGIINRLASKKTVRSVDKE